MTIELDGRKMTDRMALHDYLCEALELPAYYGRNLDALHDCLTDIASPTRLVLTGTASPCGRHFLRVFRDAAKKNRNLSVEVHEG